MHPIVAEDLKEISAKNLPFSKLAGKTIVVSGASGMIGGYLIEVFLFLNTTKNLKMKIIALTRNEKKTRKKFAQYSKRHDLLLIIRDVVLPTPIKGRVDIVIHAASQSSPKYFGSDPVGTLLPNVIGTKNLLEIARQKKVECFLFISSGEIYGILDKNQIPTKESDFGKIDSLNIRSCYAESKRLGETMCMAWHRQFGVPVKIVRPFHVYGPGMDLDDGRIFADFTKSIVKKEDLVITSTGNAKRTFCYLSDATAAILTILLSGKIAEAYNLGNSNQEVTIKELARRLIALFPEKKLRLVFDKKKVKKGYIPSSLDRSCPDLSKLERLGWIPKHSIESGFKRTVSSFS